MGMMTLLSQCSKKLAPSDFASQQHAIAPMPLQQGKRRSGAAR